MLVPVDKIMLVKKLLKGLKMNLMAFISHRYRDKIKTF